MRACAERARPGTKPLRLPRGSYLDASPAPSPAPAPGPTPTPSGGDSRRRLGRRRRGRKDSTGRGATRRAGSASAASHGARRALRPMPRHGGARQEHASARGQAQARTGAEPEVAPPPGAPFAPPPEPSHWAPLPPYAPPTRRKSPALVGPAHVSSVAHVFRLRPGFLSPSQ